MVLMTCHFYRATTYYVHEIIDKLAGRQQSALFFCQCVFNSTLTSTYCIKVKSDSRNNINISKFLGILRKPDSTDRKKFKRLSEGSLKDKRMWFLVIKWILNVNKELFTSRGNPEKLWHLNPKIGMLKIGRSGNCSISYLTSLFRNHGRDNSPIYKRALRK